MYEMHPILTEGCTWEVTLRTDFPLPRMHCFQSEQQRDSPFGKIYYCHPDHKMTIGGEVHRWFWVWKGGV
jgi:hypothetical protein